MFDWEITDLKILRKDSPRSPRWMPFFPTPIGQPCVVWRNKLQVFSRKDEKCWQNGGGGDGGGGNGPKTISPPVTRGDLITIFNDRHASTSKLLIETNCILNFVPYVFRVIWSEPALVRFWMIAIIINIYLQLPNKREWWINTWQLVSVLGRPCDWHEFLRL